MLSCISSNSAGDRKKYNFICMMRRWVCVFCSKNKSQDYHGIMDATLFNNGVVELQYYGCGPLKIFLQVALHMRSSWVRLLFFLLFLFIFRFGDIRFVVAPFYNCILNVFIIYVFFI